MNIEYLTNVIIPIREKEINEGKNLCTNQPIYVVLDLVENIVSGHSEYSPPTNYRGRDFEFGYVDMGLDCECREFVENNDNNMTDPQEITRFYTDRIIAFFLTYSAANDYIIYQKHNMNDPYIYIFNSGYGNNEMDKLLNGK